MKDLIAALSARTGLDKGIIQGVMGHFKEVVAEQMLAGVDVDLGKDFGRFATITVKGRNFFIPPTGALQPSPERRKIRFIPAPKKLRTLPPIADKP